MKNVNISICDKKKENNLGELFVVATPIGNLKDITLRAIETLKTVDLILCEDTRTSSILLKEYKIETQTTSFHKFNEKQQISKILNLLQSNKKIALVSDAGTPCVCDPGRILVNAARKANIKVTPIGGICAISTFLSCVEKENSEAFVFAGFMPKTEKEKVAVINIAKSFDVIFYESPNRVLKTFESVLNVLGENTKISFGRELTKIFEEVKTFNIKKAIEHFDNRQIKGEFIIMIHKTLNIDLDKSFIDIEEKIESLRNNGFSNRDISKVLAVFYKISKKETYKMVNCENKFYED